MEKRTIRVKYIGKFDSMICDYNHKRFCFRSRERISVIPTEVYDYIKQAKDILSTELIPYQDDDQGAEVFVPIPLKEYSRLSKPEKDAYRAKKAKAEGKITKENENE